MKDGKVHDVSNGGLNVKFLGSTGNNTGNGGGNNFPPSDATNYDPDNYKDGPKPFRYSPVIVGATTGLLSTYALVSMWPERKSTGLVLFGTGLWSAYNGVKMFR